MLVARRAPLFYFLQLAFFFIPQFLLAPQLTEIMRTFHPFLHFQLYFYLILFVKYFDERVFYLQPFLLYFVHFLK
jgi:hypothetical protein